MGEMYSEGPVAGAGAEGYEQRRPDHDDGLLDATVHGSHQDRMFDSGDTELAPDRGNAGWVVLAAGSLPKCPSSAEPRSFLASSSR
jgi:hypothetical protein